MSMLNVKYYKDLSHNYLIIKEQIGEEEQNYQHKMITVNKMKHLLDCKIRYVNQECHFYYEISSRQSITGLFAGRKWDYEQLRRLFECMQKALEELENYLLDSRKLVLQPDYIFADPETEEYFFIYYPYYTQEEAITTQMSLSQFLIDKVDHTQEEAVAIVYKVYEMEQDRQFILTEILSLFTEKEEDSEQKLNIEWSEGENVTQMSQPVESEELEWDIKQEGEGDNETFIPKHVTVAGILTILCTAAVIGILIIRNIYSLSFEENLISIAGVIFFTFVSAALLLYIMLNICNGKRRSNKNNKPAIEPFIPIEKESLNTNVYKAIPKTFDKDKESEYGNTVFLEDAMCKKENKLYGTNKGNKYHIDLEHLPCTIGKMAGSVDIVIKDSTISRIHARFSKEERGICVTDMNSTNGTFKNGLRLEPNETVLIEPGDELRFGRMSFCYR